MAVVSISRIQIRRGRKNQGSGLPQLASGEFGWATDAQDEGKIFILTLSPVWIPIPENDILFAIVDWDKIDIN